MRRSRRSSREKSVLGRSLALWARRSLPATLLFLLCLAPVPALFPPARPSVVAGVHGPGLYALVAVPDAVSRHGPRSADVRPALYGLLAALLCQLATAVLVHRFHAEAVGAPASFRASLGAVLRRAHQILLLTLAVAGGLGLAGGLLLLAAIADGLHPGLFFLLIPLGFVVAPYWLALPAVAVEGLGVKAALRRSRALTATASGTLFLLVALSFLLSLIAILLTAWEPHLLLPGAAVVGSFRASLLAHAYAWRARIVGGADVAHLRRVFD